MRFILLVFVSMCVGSAPACVPAETFDQLAQQAYIKAFNTDQEDAFGGAVALSADGSTLAVGARREDGAGTGIDPPQSGGAVHAGAVYVFVRDGTTWSQQFYIKASNTGADDEFGTSLALSGDGLWLAVGAPGEDSLNGDGGDSPDPNAGAVYVFTRTTGTWTPQAYLKASSPAPLDAFGSSVSLSGDGSILAVGAPQAMTFAGAVHVFTRTGAAWSAPQPVRATGANASGQFGSQVALSTDGATLAVGAPDTMMRGPGAAYVFARTSAMWTLQARVMASNAGGGDSFGSALALSPDGSTLAVGAPFEASAATGIDGDPAGQADNSAPRAGAVYLFGRTGTTWTQGHYIKASNTGADDKFGISVALSGDGSKLVVGAAAEDGSAKGVNHDPQDDIVRDAGAVYVFEQAGAVWSQRAYVKASNPGENDHFGSAVALSRDGAVIAVGAEGEASAASGVDGDQEDNGAHDAGAAYVFLGQRP